MDQTLLIYCGILGFVVLAVFRQPAVAMGAFLCTYGLEQWAQSQSDFFYVRNTLTNVATTCVLIWALAIRQVKGINVLHGGFSGIFWLVTALFGWSLISMLWAYNPEAAVANWKERVPYLVASIVLLPLVVGSLRELKSGFLMTLCLGSVILLLLLFTSEWQGRRIIVSQSVGIGSVRGERGNPLAVASLAGWVTLLAVLMNFRGLSRFWGLIRWPIFVLALSVSFKTASRGQLFATVIAAVVMLPLSRRIRNIGGFLAAVVGTVMLLVLAVGVFDYLGLDESQRWDTDNMVETWSESRLGTAMRVIEAWYEGGPVTWLIGLGTSASYDPRILGYYPHLVLLEVLGELGLVGFLLLCTIAIATFAEVLKLHGRVKDDPEARGLVAALAALFLFEVILTFKQGSLLGSPAVFGFAVILGRLESMSRRDPYGVLQVNPGDSVPSDFTSTPGAPVDAYGHPIAGHAQPLQ